MPPARRCRLLCVFKHYYSHCCCAVHHSQAEFHVVSSPVSPVSSPRTLQRWPNGVGYQAGLGQQVFQIVPASKLLSRRVDSVYSGESWTIYIKSLHACWLYFPSLRKANHFLLREDFRPVSHSFGCCDYFNDLIVPCEFSYY